MNRPVIRWALEWRSNNSVGGERRFFLWQGNAPCLFYTRDRARAFVQKEYGYIDKRPDLKAEPHGWQVLRVVKVRVHLEECV